MIKSQNNKVWLIQEESPSPELKAFCKNELIAKVLNARDIKTPSEAAYYFGDEKPAFTSAYQIPQIEKAVERIEKAIKQKENIIIYGDYDVDGTTSTALLMSTLQILGAQAGFYIPNRFSEGYGLNSKAIINLKSKQKANLLISCDCGITNIDEVKLAQSIGLDVIITDHHSLPDELPPAIAVLNPKLLPANHPLHWLPGVGVVYKLSEILLERAGREDKIEALLDFVALGMIADLAPLRAENRLLVQDGLKILNKTQRAGLQALLSECGYQADEESVGFMLAPRINAAGRLNDANKAVELFLSTDMANAQMLTRGLSEQNKSRQALCDETYIQAIEKIEKEINLETAKAILLADKRWHHGVVGIVASRLVEKYHLPVFLAVEEEEMIKGSARGISSIDLFVEMNKHSELFNRFGGHKAAAGFSLTLNNWAKFQIALQNELNQILKPADLQSKLSIDTAICIEDLNFEILDPVWDLAPFGMGFAKPVFVLDKEAELIDVLPLGKTAEHSKLILRQGKKMVEAIQWRVPPQNFDLAKRAGKIKIAFSPNKRTFNGNTFLQLEIKDWLVESAKNIELNSENIKTPQIIDYRSLEKPLEKLKELDTLDNFIFAEGESLEQIKNLNLKSTLISRSDEKPKVCKQLILWSYPLDDNITQKLFSIRFEKLILFGINLKKERPLKDCLKQILDFIKKNKNENAQFQIDLNILASHFELKENTCLMALNLLKESGILNFETAHGALNIQLFNSPNKVQLNIQPLQKSLSEEESLKYNLLSNPFNAQLVR